MKNLGKQVLIVVVLVIFFIAVGIVIGYDMRAQQTKAHVIDGVVTVEPIR